ncbi:MAG: Dabb family protein [Bryobacter sp.]
MRFVLYCLLAMTLSPSLTEAAEPMPGTFYHHVYFWLKKPNDAAQRQEFLAALKTMQKIPGIQHSFIGTPAADPRDVVDNSYTFYWLVTFKDKAAWKAYDTHPIHDEFRKKAGLWQKVLVMDTQKLP